MMVRLYLCRSANIPFPFSIGTFVKHLPISQPNAFYPRRINAKRIVTTSSHNSSCFETLTSRQKNQIHHYIEALLDWNQKMNLTAVTDVNEVMKRHIEDSLAMLPPIRDSYVSHCNSSIDNLKLVDVGTGPGLPGLVLAIACPGWKVTLLESMNKRCVFLEHAVSVTGLSNVEVVRGRAEVEVRNAEKSIQLMGASIFQLCSVESHSPYGQRTAIICVKDQPTPRKYPRDPGTPAKLPL
ncbi:uncharacterized protein LOC110658103 isoform X2 [Hevea brasiliensis]|uniref:uncharacterized protein LOC110658103 isoform X2 n=1 Tax=Hevea brasiliensis TaxID=3981 RepID=UPI0025E4C0FF|nr:uncharacterized protein LOC110658103 isoform X2 [Hevea brasiliensis]